MDISASTDVYFNLEAKAMELGYDLNSKQLRALYVIIEEKKNIFITGAAGKICIFYYITTFIMITHIFIVIGTGKSYLLKCVIKFLEERYDQKDFFVTASTGMAGYQFEGGQTLHGYAGIGLGEGDVDSLFGSIKATTKDRWMNTKVLIIDEISMIHKDLFEKLNSLAQKIRQNNEPWGGIQLILVGDFYQLPPVDKRKRKSDSIYVFQAPSWQYSVHECILLDEIFRQKNDTFVNLLNRIRTGDLTNDDITMIRSLERNLDLPKGIQPVNLFTMRTLVDSYNDNKLREISDALHTHNADDFFVINRYRDELNRACTFPDVLKLKKGAQVMLLKNMPMIGLANGDIGIVVDFPVSCGGYPKVRFSKGGEFVISPEIWEIKDKKSGAILASRTQIPLVLSWAITIHKIQGATVEFACVDSSGTFEPGQLYVGLSRVRDIDGLQVVNFQPRHCIVSPVVKGFYTELQSRK
jgi:ATP-dependent DNA helicase PIF1